MNECLTGFDAALSGYRPRLRPVEIYRPRLRPVEIGVVAAVAQGVVRVRGLPDVAAMEVVRFADDSLGIAFDLDAAEVGAVLLRDQGGLRAGASVERTGRVLDTPVGAALLGRVVNALGEPLDDGEPIATSERWPVERPALPILARAPVSVPLATGIKAVDAAIPIGRGQRELILGDRQTGKTALAVDAILNQADSGVVCVYCAIGQRGAAVAQVIAALREHDALSYSVVVVAAGTRRVCKHSHPTPRPASPSGSWPKGAMC